MQFGKDICWSPFPTPWITRDMWGNISTLKMWLLMRPSQCTCQRNCTEAEGDPQWLPNELLGPGSSLLARFVFCLFDLLSHCLVCNTVNASVPWETLRTPLIGLVPHPRWDPLFPSPFLYSMTLDHYTFKHSTVPSSRTPSQVFCMVDFYSLWILDQSPHPPGFFWVFYITQLEPLDRWTHNQVNCVDTS